MISKSLHLYVYPNSSEYQSKAVPDTVYVVGQELKDDIHEFCDDINVAVGPAFRFDKLWVRDRLYKPDPKTFYCFLVGLPIGLDDCTHILNLLVNILENFNEKKFPVLGKNHIQLMALSR